ncbi:MAG TPA: hypothetical protein VM432_05255 [Bdellovibrionales bacterium]|nr:hypothetical protein [Bdellovibrionales bacterium]
MESGQDIKLDESLRLKQIVALEEEAIRTYSEMRPYIDTPELVRLIDEIKRDHFARRSALCAALAMEFDNTCDELMTYEPDQIATIGDTAETIVAVEKLFEIEQKVEAAWKGLESLRSDLPDLYSLIHGQASYEHEDFAKISRILTSVRAAARLLGPGDQPTIIHH